MSQQELGYLEEVGRLLQQGDRDQALQRVRDELESAQANGAADRVALAWSTLAQVHGALNDLPEAAKALERAVAAIPGGDEDPDLALPRFRCLHGLGQLLIRLDRKSRARETLERAWVVAGALPEKDSKHHQSFATIPLAWLLLDAGEVDRALPMVESACQTLSQNEQDQANLLQVLVLLAQARVQAKLEHALLPTHVPSWLPHPKLAESLANHTQQLAHLATSGKMAPWIPRDLARWSTEWMERVAGKKARLTADMVGMVGALEGLCERPDMQAKALEKAEALYRDISEPAMALKARRARALVLLAGNQSDQARKLLREALEEAAQLRDPELVSELAQGLAQVHYALGEIQETESLLRQGLAQADLVENHDLASTAALSLGLLLAHSGRMGETTKLFERAEARLDKNNPLHQLAVVHLDCARKEIPCPCQTTGQQVRQPAPPVNPAFAEMLKEVMPPELAQKLEGLLSKNLGDGVDPETAAKLAEMEARTLQRLQGMMGMLKESKGQG